MGSDLPGEGIEGGREGGGGKARRRGGEGKVRFLLGFWSGSEGSEQGRKVSGVVMDSGTRLDLESIAARRGARQPPN